MAGVPDAVGPLAFESYGVTVALEFADPGLSAHSESFLPPRSRAVPIDTRRRPMFVAPDGRLHESAASPFTPRSSAPMPGAAAAVTQLAAELRHYVALHSHYVFVHAGVVAIEGAAVVLPGRTLVGKTTLVAALVRLGAEYLSDEYAVVDERGLVHPFPKPLSLRVTGGQATRLVQADDLGGREAEDVLPVRLVAVTRFRPGTAHWNPAPMSRADALLALVANTVAARSQPTSALRRLRLLVEDAIACEGARGEAEPAARALIRQLESLKRVPASDA